MSLARTTCEQQVRDGKSARPAGIVDRLSDGSRTVLLGLWACDRREGPILPTGLFLGKSEAERDWPKAHEELRDAGLIEFRIEERATPSSADGRTTYLIWNMTVMGASVMNDLYAWRGEMQQARDADRLAANLRRSGP